MKLRDDVGDLLSQIASVHLLYAVACRFPARTSSRIGVRTHFFHFSLLFTFSSPARVTDTSRVCREKIDCVEEEPQRTRVKMGLERAKISKAAMDDPVRSSLKTSSHNNSRSSEDVFVALATDGERAAGRGSRQVHIYLHCSTPHSNSR